MILSEEGRLDLDDSVSLYLPEFEEVTVLDAATGATRPPARPITIRDLLLFTSGINSRNAGPYREARVRSRSIPLSQFNQDFADDVPRWPVMSRSDPITSETTACCVT